MRLCRSGRAFLIPTSSARKSRGHPIQGAMKETQRHLFSRAGIRFVDFDGARDTLAFAALLLGKSVEVAKKTGKRAPRPFPLPLPHNKGRAKEKANVNSQKNSILL